MKKTLVLALTLFSSLILLGQDKPKTEPLIIQGQITNSPEKYLKISFRDKNGQYLTDTLNLDESGRFYLKTFKIKEPQITSIQKNNIQINNIFVAPGYNLTITAEGKDFLSLLKSTKISGIGSESNNYRSILHSIYIARMDTTRWNELNEKDLLAYINYYKQLQDSVAHAVFDRNSVQDEYLNHFGSLVRLDNDFLRLSMLLDKVNRSKYNYENTIAFVKRNFDNNELLNNIFKDEFLASNVYRGSIGNEYLDYLLNLDYKKDSTLRNQKGYNLKKVNETYTGKVKEFVLYNKMERMIEGSSSFKKLNDQKEQLQTYISSLTNPYYKKSLESKFVKKEAEILRTQVGKPAPKFKLQSNTGETYSLDDFKGKVVYIDLWASWCSPCRAETPFLKTLYNKYKNDARIAFVGIAVHDGINEWKKAIKEDGPEWLQLLDKNEIVGKSYVANTIPKFIVINKQGNIVSFDAPRPSSGKDIENLLNKTAAE